MRTKMLAADSNLIVSMMPDQVDFDNLTLRQIDGAIRALDRRMTVITKHIRSIRQSLLSAPPKPLQGLSEPDMAPTLHVRLVFKLTGLKAALDANTAQRSKLVYARTVAREAA